MATPQKLPSSSFMPAKANLISANPEAVMESVPFPWKKSVSITYPINLSHALFFQ
jgi:hypothetical protein